MKNVLKLTRRFVGILMASVVLLLLLNFIVLGKTTLQRRVPGTLPMKRQVLCEKQKQDTYCPMN